MRAKDRAKIEDRTGDAYNYLVNEKGMAPHVASGIIANLQHESGSRKLNIHAYNPDDVGKPSIGLAQWRGERKKEYDAFIGEDNSLENQLDFLVNELENKSYLGWEELQATDNPMDAALVFSNKFERPNKKYAKNNKRVEYASEIYRKYGDENLYSVDDNGNYVTLNPNTATEEEKNRSDYFKKQFYKSNLTNYEKSVENPTFEEENKKQEESTPGNKEESKEESDEEEETAWEKALKKKVQRNNYLNQLINEGAFDFKSPPTNTDRTKIKRIQQSYMQDGGTVPVSKNGVFDYPKQKVLVPTEEGNITMEGVDYPIEGVSQQTGERIMMQPGENYNFKNTTEVLETPVLQWGGRVSDTTGNITRQPKYGSIDDIKKKRPVADISQLSEQEYNDQLKRKEYVEGDNLSGAIHQGAVQITHPFNYVGGDLLGITEGTEKIGREQRLAHTGYGNTFDTGKYYNQVAGNLGNAALEYAPVGLEDIAAKRLIGRAAKGEVADFGLKATPIKKITQAEGKKAVDGKKELPPVPEGLKGTNTFNQTEGAYGASKNSNYISSVEDLKSTPKTTINKKPPQKYNLVDEPIIYTPDGMKIKINTDRLKRGYKNIRGKTVNPHNRPGQASVVRDIKRSTSERQIRDEFDRQVKDFTTPGTEAYKRLKKIGVNPENLKKLDIVTDPKKLKKSELLDKYEKIVKYNNLPKSLKKSEDEKIDYVINLYKKKQGDASETLKLNHRPHFSRKHNRVYIPENNTGAGTPKSSVSHEIGHAIQQEYYKSLPKHKRDNIDKYQKELKKIFGWEGSKNPSKTSNPTNMEKIKNSGTFMDKEIKKEILPDTKSSNSLNYFSKASGGREPFAFLRGLRSDLKEFGIIDSMYDKITLKDMNNMLSAGKGISPLVNILSKSQKARDRQVKSIIKAMNKFPQLSTPITAGGAGILGAKGLSESKTKKQSQ